MKWTPVLAVILVVAGAPMGAAPDAPPLPATVAAEPAPVLLRLPCPVDGASWRFVDGASAGPGTEYPHCGLDAESWPVAGVARQPVSLSWGAPGYKTIVWTQEQLVDSPELRVTPLMVRGSGVAIGVELPAYHGQAWSVINVRVP